MVGRKLNPAFGVKVPVIAAPFMFSLLPSPDCRT